MYSYHALINALERERCQGAVSCSYPALVFICYIRAKYSVFPIYFKRVQYLSKRNTRWQVISIVYNSVNKKICIQISKSCHLASFEGEWMPSSSSGFIQLKQGQTLSGS